MKKREPFVICPKCGVKVFHAGNYCPNCATPLLADEAEEAKQENSHVTRVDASGRAIGYFNFYGAAPEDDTPPDPKETRLGPVGLLRLLAAVAMIASLVVGVALNGFTARFNWGRAGLWVLGGAVVCGLLTGASYLIQAIRKE